MKTLALRTICWLFIASLVALQATAQAASAEKNAEKARKKAEKGAKGSLWASGDDGFVIYLNDHKLMQGDLSKLADPEEVKLKPGDVIAVRAINQGGERGVGLIFVSDNGKIVISTNTGDWYQFEPVSAARWWEVPATARQQKRRAVKADNQTLKHDIEGPAAQGCEEIIWADFSRNTAYLFHVLTVEELME